MKKKTILWLTIPILVLAVTLISACTKTTPTSSPTPAPEAKVTGTVTYLEKVALPPGAVVEVKLQDASGAPAPAITIGEQVITTSGNQVPFPFEIKYNPATINPRGTYAVEARITVDGKVWFDSRLTMYRVITGGRLSTVKMILEKAEPD